MRWHALSIPCVDKVRKGARGAIAFASGGLSYQLGMDVLPYSSDKFTEIVGIGAMSFHLTIDITEHTNDSVAV